MSYIRKQKLKTHIFMDILQIFALILGALMIAHCFVYATRRPKIFSNIRDMLISGAIAVGITTMTVVHPAWWTVAICLYMLILFRMSLCNSHKKLCDFGYYGYNISVFRRVLRVILSWVSLITIVFISINMVKLSQDWYEIVVYFPVVVIVCMTFALRVKEALENPS